MNTEMHKKPFRPAAVPLITVDPYFSIWSCDDNLYDDFTKHWTGLPAPLVLAIQMDKKFYSMGATMQNLMQAQQRIPQTSLEVRPLSTIYNFENELFRVEITFTTPHIVNRLDLMSRPITYIKYDIEKKFDEDKDFKFIFAINSLNCVTTNRQNVTFKKTDYSLSCGNTVQNPLTQTGDGDVCMIDWGYLHLCDKTAFAAVYDGLKQDLGKTEINREYNARADMPYIVTERSDASGVIMVAYDEIYPIEYFGRKTKEYFTNYFDSFDEMVKDSLENYEEIKSLCDEFDQKVMNDASALGEDYKNIVSLAFRQVVAAHKLVSDENGEEVLLSKECNSNGCIGTLDVTYPSTPMFLKYNPKLVEAMLRPIIRYAKSDGWKFDFAPHDVGKYPLANGQVYGNNLEENQMPVEECGNMLISLAAIERYSGSKKLFDENRELMKKWADYLVKFGYDPGNQLCTDDFAGHLAHNCNLSLKAILGIAAYGRLSGDSTYTETAKQYAARWEGEAKADHGATRLTFDKPDGWSLKYNMVWDSLLGFDMFSAETKKAEVEFYKTKLNRYGVPLDSRAQYTKLDWLMWSTCIYNDAEYFKAVTQSITNMINETTDRVPLTDWYYTNNAMYNLFRNRSVVGGLFINML